MKLGKYIGWITSLASAVVLLTASQGATAAIGSIVGSKHDFSSGGPNATYKSANQTQVCVYCHAPHNTSTTSGNSLLWNRANSTATSYTLYASPTLNATLGAPTGISKLCLSCHDGTIAIDSFGGATGNVNAGGGALLGTDLSNDHPISFTYDAALVTADPGIKAITTAVSIGSNTATTIAGLLDSNGQMQCSSCHDVHNTAAKTAVESKLLKISNSGSGLCVACHVK